MNEKSIAKRYLTATINFGMCASLVFGIVGAPYGLTAAQAAAPSSFDRGCGEMLKKRFREAISCFTEAINVNDKDANSYFRRGQCFLCINDIEKAMSDFDRAIGITEGNDQYYLWRGTAYGQLGKDELAIEDFLHAFKINPELVINYNKQISDTTHNQPVSPVAAELQNRNAVVLGNGANATKDFTEAVKRASQHLTAKFRPGSIYSGITTQNQDTGEKKVVYIVPRAVNEPKHKGREYWVLKNAKHDLDNQMRAIDSLPGDFKAMFERALDYQEMLDPDRASLDFTRLVETKPEETMYWLARAFFLHQIGSDELAKHDISKAQDLDLTLPVRIDFDDEPGSPAASSQK